MQHVPTLFFHSPCFDGIATAAIALDYLELFPQVRYSAGILRSKQGAKVSAMRNPWLDFESVPLGPICARLGGGGHRRVGSIALPAEETAQAPGRLARLLEELRRAERAGGSPRLKHA